MLIPNISSIVVMATDTQAKIKMGSSSWVRTITSPFRKARTLINPSKDKKHQQVVERIAGCDDNGMSLHGEVMACTYEDVRVMWYLLDKSRPHACNSMS